MVVGKSGSGGGDVGVIGDVVPARVTLRAHQLAQHQQHHHQDQHIGDAAKVNGGSASGGGGAVVVVSAAQQRHGGSNHDLVAQAPPSVPATRDKKDTSHPSDSNDKQKKQEQSAAERAAARAKAAERSRNRAAAPAVDLAPFEPQRQEVLDGLFLDHRANTWQPCPHKFYMMPFEFEVDGYLSIWTQKAYAALSRAPCRTMNIDDAEVIIPGIETACPVNWPFFGDHRHFQRNYVYSDHGAVKCHDSLPSRFSKYWKDHSLRDVLQTRSQEEGDEEEKRNDGKFIVVFRSGGFPVTWMDTDPVLVRDRIMLAHSSRTTTNTARTLNVSQ